MARLVLMADSDTGRMIDATGTVREGARYRKFAGRMLSTDRDPTLDYGYNGGDALTVSRGGSKGREIRLLAETVSVPGRLEVGGRTVEEIAAKQSEGVLSLVKGKEGEISVTEAAAAGAGGTPRKAIVVSLDQAVLGKLEMISDFLGTSPRVVTKGDLASAIAGLEVRDGDTLEDVKGTLRVLLERLGNIAREEA